MKDSSMVPISINHETSEVMVSVKDLTRKFGNFIAANKVTFDVTAGEIFGFLGPNGAGKSTTIRMLCGLLAPTSGQGSVMGYDIYTQQEIIKQNIGYMSQKFSLYTDLTVEENINFFGGIYGLKNNRLIDRKEWAIELSGLKEHRHTIVRKLAGGWKQRLALGCAILHEPRVVFLDEPTSGVDPLSRRMFWDLIYQMSSQGITVFVTTHYMEEAEYCDRLGMIYKGNLIAMGTPLELKTKTTQIVLANLICSRIQDALEQVKVLPFVKNSVLFGLGLHITLTDPKYLPDLNLYLMNNGFEVEELNLIPPSLEDVFVTLIEQSDAEELANIEAKLKAGVKP